MIRISFIMSKGTKGQLIPGFDKERFLYSELFIYNSNHDIKDPFHLNSTVFEIEKHFNTREYFNTEHLKRMSIAPVPKTALEYWIYEIEHYILGIGRDEDTVNLDYCEQLVYDVYQNVSIGKVKYLYEYSGFLVQDYGNGELEKKVLIEQYLEDISTGVSIAFVLPVLKEELRKFNDKPLLSESELRTIDIRNDKDKLTNKQQILLLNKLGVFDLPILGNLTMENKGKLFSHIINRDEKNSLEYIRNLGRSKSQVSMEKYFVNTEVNVNRVNAILKEVGLEK